MGGEQYSDRMCKIAAINTTIIMFMKGLFFIVILLASYQVGRSQDYFRPQQRDTPPAIIQAPALHEHKGFLLSLSAGPIWGATNVTGVDPQYGSFSMDFTGTGALLDFKVGFAIMDNLFVHLTDIGAAVASPKVTVNGQNASMQATQNVSVSEGMIGGGFTYYVMPSNIFFAGTIGSGYFTFTDNSSGPSNQSFNTFRGFSYQIKAGKEWFVSRKWGIGAALSYLATSVDNSQNGIPENWTSGRFSIVFNATLN